MTDAGRPQPEVITSPANPTVKLLRSLHRKKGRSDSRAFVVEGHRAILDGVAAGFMPRLVALQAGAEQHPRVEAWLAGAGPAVTVRSLDRALFASVAGTVTPQPILAVFPMPDLRPDGDGAPLVLVLDGVSDPGNVGTLLRSAAAAGATAVVLTGATADPYGPKVVRAAMGAHFHVPLVLAGALDEDPSGSGLVRATEVIAVAEAGAETTYDSVDWTRAASIIVGSEAHGPSAPARALANAAITIPMAAGVESLNAGVAGSIILFEARRQRTRTKPTQNGPPDDARSRDFR